MDSTLITAIVSMITGVAAWFVGRRKQKNDFIADLQASINMLADYNHKLLAENLELRKEIVELKVQFYAYEQKKEQKKGKK
ncbi:MAG: hypothetical protein LBT56_02890 [Prevotellaceae bacterium]|jgi:hypothetical protein|nr:hypothetical protein [Prevotellaceae bacterium]